MVDIAEAAVDKGVATVAGSLDRLIKKEKITAAHKEAALARIKGSTNYDELGGPAGDRGGDREPGAQGQDPKQVDDLLPPEVIIASNTSSISITQLAAATSRADRFIGMHFFNPVPMMALVEIIRGYLTSDATPTRSKEWRSGSASRRSRSRTRPASSSTASWCPMINEAIFALAEGLATAEDIDAGMKLGCNHPIGPLALADMIGLDVMLAVMEVFYNGFNDPKYRPAPLLKEMVDAGHLGRKSGRGFYSYGTAA